MSSQSVIVNGRASASSDAAVLLPACDSSDNGHLPFLNGTIGRARAHCRRGQPIHEASDVSAAICDSFYHLEFDFVYANRSGGERNECAGGEACASRESPSRFRENHGIRNR